MKRRMWIILSSVVCIVAIIYRRKLLEIMLFLLIFCMQIYSLFFGGYKNKRADDVISKAVYQELGGKEMLYQGKSLEGDGVVHYKYLIRTGQEDQLTRFQEVANQTIQTENVEDRIAVLFCIKTYRGEEGIVQLCNYSDAVLDGADYGALKCCKIGDLDPDNHGIYANLEIYSRLSEIEVLEVSEETAKMAEKEGFDWHEHFPKLKKFKVIPRGY